VENLAVKRYRHWRAGAFRNMLQTRWGLNITKISPGLLAVVVPSTLIAFGLMMYGMCGKPHGGQGSGGTVCKRA